MITWKLTNHVHYDLRSYMDSIASWSWCLNSWSEPSSWATPRMNHKRTKRLKSLGKQSFREVENRHRISTTCLSVVLGKRNTENEGDKTTKEIKWEKLSPQQGNISLWTTRLCIKCNKIKSLFRHSRIQKIDLSFFGKKKKKKTTFIPKKENQKKRKTQNPKYNGANLGINERETPGHSCSRSRKQLVYI